MQKKANKNKSARQKQLEAEQQQREELQKKNVNSIYRQLVKVIHPDLEQDEAIRKEKEMVMAQLSDAYQNKDLPALLKLEMQWLQKESNHLSALSDEKLKLYNQILKEQIDELEQELNELAMDPRYAALDKYAYPDRNTLSKTGLWIAKNNLAERYKSISYSIERLASSDALDEVKEILRVYKDAMRAQDYY